MDDGPRFAAVTGLAVIASLLSALLIKQLAGLQGDLSVLAVAVAVTTGRILRTRDPRARLLSVALLPVIAVVAALVGGRMFHQPVLGDTLFTLGVSAGIWLRRFGPLAAAAGAVLSVPLVALLVVPAPVGGGAGHDLWSAVIATQAGLWAWAALTVAERSGFLATISGPPALARSNARARSNTHAHGGESRRRGDFLPRRVAGAPVDTTARRLRVATSRPLASTRMSLQMGLGLGAAFLLGHALWPTHWTWVVISAFVVASGNRGRADVIHKCGLRILGAAVGTVAATLLVRALPAGDDLAIVLIIVVLVLGTWLRQIGYAYWAAAVTSVVALLNGYYGERSSALLGTRLEEIVCGGAIATVIALSVLPVKTSDVLRRRVADALAALTDYLTAARRRDLDALVSGHARLQHALASLEEIAPPLRLAQRFSRDRDQHPASALRALVACGPAAARITATVTQRPELLGAEAFAEALTDFQAAVVKARRALARQPSSDVEPASPSPRPPSPPPLPVAQIVALARGMDALTAQSDSVSVPARPAPAPPRPRELNPD